MTYPTMGALVSPPAVTPSDDDVDECVNAVEYAARGLEDAMSAIKAADVKLKAYLGYGGIERLANLPELDRVHNDLLARLDWLMKGAK